MPYSKSERKISNLISHYGILIVISITITLVNFPITTISNVFYYNFCIVFGITPMRADKKISPKFFMLHILWSIII